MAIRPVDWKSGAVVLLDQRLLPGKEIYRRYRSVEAVARAIEQMVVRGAPAIGVTAAYGVRVGAEHSRAKSLAALRQQLLAAIARLAKTRPTAVNLFWALERMRGVVEADYASVTGLKKAVAAEAKKIHDEDVAANRQLSTHGAELLKSGQRVLTHCNAGALATGGHYGTALGVLKAAKESGKKIVVYADETRPYLQGARLTAWELAREGIDAYLITDSMAGHFISRDEIDVIVVGADRIAANGDTANKIGTYTLSVLAKENGIPFYVAAPLSTVDLRTPNGREIPIEERHEDEVTHAGGRRVAPTGFSVRNPAFDVTPARHVTAIITEAGVARPPYKKSLRKLKERAQADEAKKPVTRKKRAAARSR